MEEYLRLAYQGQRSKDPRFNCQLVTQFDPNLGQVEVEPQELRRVLLNLFNNAFYAVLQRQKQQPTGYQPTIHICTQFGQFSSMASQMDCRAVEIRVTNNGIGIPKAL